MLHYKFQDKFYRMFDVTLDFPYESQKYVYDSVTIVSSM